MLVLVVGSGSRWDASVPEVVEENYVEVAPSLAEVLEEVLNSVDSVKHLKSIYHIVSS